MQETTNLNFSNNMSIFIDGKEYSAFEGETILQVCRRNNIDIPTLCYDPRLNPNGSCLLCTVQVEGSNKLILACVTKVKKGMKIITNNELIYNTRRRTLELLLSNHYADCRGNCYEKCPANIDVQGYIALASVGKYEEALQLIRKNNPLPMVCGRVCVRYCEANCQRKDIDSSVAVNFIKRYIADLMTDKLPKEPKPNSTGKKVAVVGSGPAGLSAAYYLAKYGHNVTIFEAQKKLGGMLRYGIPEYRLPSKILDKEIDIILSLGIKTITGVALGKKVKLSDLHKEFDAIFLAIGAWKAKKMQIENEDALGVLEGIEFLRKVKEDENFRISGNVLVVGGGNTAIDAARTAIRLGAEKVTIVYRRTREEMPAEEDEINDALDEGVEIMYLTAPIKVISENGMVKALLCQKMKLGQPDESGRAKPIPIPNSEFSIPASYIISAIGQDVDITCLDDDELKLEFTKWKTIKIDEKNFTTNIPKIFAGGDAVTAPKAAIDAIAAGRKAAYVINHFLLTNQIINYPNEFISKKINLSSIPKSYFETLQKIERSKPNYLPAEERIKNFNEVDKGIDEIALKNETSRCLSCGCSDIYNCKLREYAALYNACQRNFIGKFKIYEIDNRHPFISIDKNKCILCGKCVYLCKDIIGSSALGFVNRGFETYISTAYNQALNNTSCISCGNCLDICPTGAISISFNTINQFAFKKYKPTAWETQTHNSICSFCGLACDLDLDVYDPTIWFVRGKWNNSLQIHDFTCKYGRFGYYLLKSNFNSFPIPNIQKIITPQIRIHDNSNITYISNISKNTKHDVDLDFAIQNISHNFKAISDKYGSDKILFLVSPYATNEEIYLLNKIASKFGPNNITSLSLIFSLILESKIFQTTKHKIYSTATLNDVLNADIIIIPSHNSCNSFIYTHPVVTFTINTAIISKSDLQIHYLDSTKFVQIIHDNSISNSNNNIYSIYKSQLSTFINHTLELLSKGKDNKNIIFIISLYENQDLSGYVNYILFQNFANYINNHTNNKAKILLLRKHANSQGLINTLCYNYKNLDHLKIYENITKGYYKAVFSLGEDIYNPNKKFNYRNLFESLEYIVAMDCIENETTKQANVVLPNSSYLEKSGSIISTENKLKKFSAIFNQDENLTNNVNTNISDIVNSFNKPKMQSWQILAKLYESITSNITYNQLPSPTSYEMNFEQLQNEIFNEFQPISSNNTKDGIDEKIVNISNTANLIYNNTINDLEALEKIINQLNLNSFITTTNISTLNISSLSLNHSNENLDSNSYKNGCGDSKTDSIIHPTYKYENAYSNLDLLTTIETIKNELEKLLK